MAQKGVWYIDSTNFTHVIQLGAVNRQFATLIIDSKTVAYALSPLMQNYYYVKFPVGDTYILLRISKGQNKFALAHNGMYQDIDEPANMDIVEPSREFSKQEQFIHDGKNLLYVITGATILNVLIAFLQMGKWPKTYYYFTSQIPLALIWESEGFISSIGTLLCIAAVVIVAFYLFLCFMVKKHAWAAITALIVFSIDTVLVFIYLFMAREFTFHAIVNLIMHAAVIYSLVQLAKTKIETHIYKYLKKLKGCTTFWYSLYSISQC